MNTNYMQRHGIDNSGSARIGSIPDTRNEVGADAKLHIRYVLPVAWSAADQAPGATPESPAAIARQ